MDGPTPELLPSIPGRWTTQEITVAGRTYRLTMPAEPDAFLDDPATLAAHERDDYMPYWPYLWPAARAMAEAVARAPWIPGTKALEIGAGIGLVGLVGLSRGLEVTFSDYDQTAVDVAVHNAQRNGFRQARGLCLDWREPIAERYAVILGCDVIYESRNHGPILDTVETMLGSGGVCWMGDGGRQIAGQFIDLARELEFDVVLRDADGNLLAEPRVGAFQLIELRRPGR